MTQCMKHGHRLVRPRIDVMDGKDESALLAGALRLRYLRCTHIQAGSPLVDRRLGKACLDLQPLAG